MTNSRLLSSQDIEFWRQRVQSENSGSATVAHALFAGRDAQEASEQIYQRNKMRGGINIIRANLQHEQIRRKFNESQIVFDDSDLINGKSNGKTAKGSSCRSVASALRLDRHALDAFSPLCRGILATPSSHAKINHKLTSQHRLRHIKEARGGYRTRYQASETKAKHEKKKSKRKGKTNRTNAFSAWEDIGVSPTTVPSPHDSTPLARSNSVANLGPNYYENGHYHRDRTARGGIATIPDYDARTGWRMNGKRRSKCENFPAHLRATDAYPHSLLSKSLGNLHQLHRQDNRPAKHRPRGAWKKSQSKSIRDRPRTSKTRNGAHQSRGAGSTDKKSPRTTQLSRSRSGFWTASTKEATLVGGDEDFDTRSPNAEHPASRLSSSRRYQYDDMAGDREYDFNTVVDDLDFYRYKQGKGRKAPISVYSPPKHNLLHHQTFVNAKADRQNRDRKQQITTARMYKLMRVADNQAVRDYRQRKKKVLNSVIRHFLLPPPPAPPPASSCYYDYDYYEYFYFDSVNQFIDLIISNSDMFQGRGQDFFRYNLDDGVNRDDTNVLFQYDPHSLDSFEKAPPSKFRENLARSHISM